MIQAHRQITLIARATEQKVKDLERANKHKPLKKGTKPSRNNTNISRRYSTTESDDQTGKVTSDLIDL